MFKKGYKKTTPALAALMIIGVMALVQGCGGGSTPGSTALNTKSTGATGAGKVAALVKFNNRAAGRSAGQSLSTSVTVNISISGVYSGDGKEFPAVTTSAVIDMSQGSARVPVLDVPVGVKHLLVVQAVWSDGFTETLKALIPEITTGQLTTVTADPASTALAEAALYYANRQGIRLTDVSDEILDALAEAIAEIYAAGTPYQSIQPSQVEAYISNMGIPVALTLNSPAGSIVAGNTFQFTGAVLDGNGNPVAGASATYTFSDLTVGSVDANGLFTAVMSGSGVMTATYNSLSATAAVTVIAVCTADTECDDGLPLTLDTCTSAGSASAACTHTTIACNTTADCNDSNVLTIDACTGGGTISAACSNTPIPCNVDVDCDDANALSIDVCTNGGTLSAVCNNTAYACNTSSDCAAPSPVCMNGGLVSALCIACGTDLDCNDGDVNTADSCMNAGTPAAACMNTPIGMVAASISIGDDHACAVQADSTVKCWGYNYNGALGDGSGGGGMARVAGRHSSSPLPERLSHTSPHKSGGTKSAARGAAARSAAVTIGGFDFTLEPVTVSGLSGAVQVTAKGYHSCALLNDGTVQCWGPNGSGQLGDGSYTDAYVPVAVSGLAGAVQIDNNYDDTCAVINDGSVQCWGYNYYGQLGDGSTMDSPTPAAVAGLSGPAIQVAVGGEHTCALINDGTVQCWGYNGYSQLGDGTNTDSLTPVTVSGLSGATKISIGYEHTCALISDGTVQCWGYNGDGQLGDGTTTDSNMPLAVSGLTGVVDIAAGEYHSCAMLSNGQAQCWGYNGYGELGVPVTDTYGELTPVTVTDVQGTITGAAAGNESTCFVFSVGNFKCVGNNYNGQLGDGRGPINDSPVSEFGLNVVDAALYSGSSCAINIDNTVSCWGFNSYGQLLDGSIVDRPYAVTASGYAGAVDIAVGNNHSCALMSGGSVQCTGYNYYGNLGDGTNTDSPTPVAVSGLSGPAVQLDAGGDSTCALINDGTVQCWGINGYGNLGDGSYVDSNVPVTVSGLSGVTSIAVSYYHVCALINDGSVQCWGYNGDGALGDGTNTDSPTPAAVSGLSGTVVALSVSNGHTCALINDGTVQCWGYNGYGQLGDSTYTSSNMPVTVLGLSGASAISTSGNSTCAVVSGMVECWGANGNGELGDGTAMDSLSPVMVSGIFDATDLYSGDYRTCANTASSGLMCWGPDMYWWGI